jgi:hypothetical protein
MGEQELEIISQLVSEGNTVNIIILVTAFTLFFILNKIMDSRTKKNQVSLNDDLVIVIRTLAEQVSKDKDKIREKCRLAITLGFSKLYAGILDEVVGIIITNNVANNKSLIEGNLKNIINKEYYNLYSTLNIFELHEKHLSIYVKDEWKEEIRQMCEAIIFDVSLETNFKLTSIKSKLNILTSNYSIYVTNKAFNE